MLEKYQYGDVLTYMWTPVTWAIASMSTNNYVSHPSAKLMSYHNGAHWKLVSCTITGIFVFAMPGSPAL